MTSNHPLQDGMKGLAPTFLSFGMENFMAEEELMMDMPHIAQWLLSRHCKSKAIPFRDVWWSLKEMRKVDHIILKPTSRNLRKELAIRLFSFVWTVEHWTTKECGLPTHWEACWQQLCELRFWLKECTVEMRQESFHPLSEFWASYWTELRTWKQEKLMRCSKLIFHQTDTRKCTTSLKLREKIASRNFLLSKKWIELMKTVWVRW